MDWFLHDRDINYERVKSYLSLQPVFKSSALNPLNTERKLNVHETFKRGLLIHVQFTSCAIGKATNYFYTVVVTAVWLSIAVRYQSVRLYLRLEKLQWRTYISIIMQRNIKPKKLWLKLHQRHFWISRIGCFQTNTAFFGQYFPSFGHKLENYLMGKNFFG